MRFSISRIAALTCLLLSGATLCFGNAYKIYDIASDNGTFIDGIGKDGTVFIESVLCPPPGGPCYGAINPITGSSTSLASAPDPALFDNGSPCTPTGLPTDATVSLAVSVCNGSTQAFSGYINYFSPSDCPPNATGCVADGGTYRGIFANSVDTGYLDTWADRIVVNSAGDIAWADSVFEEDFEAVPAVPESPTLILLGTGLLALFAINLPMTRPRRDASLCRRPR
jgi:hypothetical protein